jgi:septal ring factor EnvC (AmiA/AmiB activator)
MADDNTDDTAAANHSIPDPFALAIGLCQVAANAKTIEPALKRLRKLGRDIAKAEQKLAAVTAQVEQKQTELAAREAAIDEREAAIARREDEFASSVETVRDELREHHAHLEQTHRQLVHRIMSTAGILGEWNWNLQSPPTWEQLRRMVAGLPEDLPAPRAEVVSQETREDWTGHTFIADSSLTRSISHKATSQ